MSSSPGSALAVRRGQREKGIWASNISRERLLQKITLLAMLGPVRHGVTEHNLVSRPEPRRHLTVEQEAEIVSNLAFLSYRRKDSGTVTAVCIEENQDGQGMVVRLAVNGGNVSHIETGVQQICGTLERVSGCGTSFADDAEDFFCQVVVLDFSRISARLKLGKKYSIESSRLMQLYTALHDKSVSVADAMQTVILCEKATAIIELYRKLKGLSKLQPEPTTYEIMGKIIKLAHELNKSPATAACLHSCRKLSNVEKLSIGDLLEKLAQYYNASLQLVSAARRSRYSIFRKIRVESFQTKVPEDVRMLSRPGSALPMVKMLAKTHDVSKLLRHHNGSQVEASATILRRLDGTRAGIKVHAELKLLFYYETRPTKNRPRVICANKSACYLCNLFFKVHGQFQVPRTFGKLNERWIVPDWLDNISSSQVAGLKSTLERFDAALDLQLHQVLGTVIRMPDPIESAIGLQAHWSDSTFEAENNAQLDIGELTDQASAEGVLERGLIEAPRDPLLPDTAQQIRFSRDSGLLLAQDPTRIGLSCTPIPSAVSFATRSSTSSSTSSEFYETLALGTSTERFLLDKEKSFIASFYQSLITVSFSPARNHSSEASSLPRARIGVHQYRELVKATGERKNIVRLEDLQPGREVVLDCAFSRSERACYIIWKDRLISIRYNLDSSRSEAEDFTLN